MVWKAFILVSLLMELNLIIQDLELSASIKTLSERFFHSKHQENFLNWQHQKLVSCQDYISLHYYSKQKINTYSFQAWEFSVFFFPKLNQRWSEMVYHRIVRVKAGRKVPVPCQLLLCPSLSTWLSSGDCSIFSLSLFPFFFLSVLDTLKFADLAQSLKWRNLSSEDAKLNCDSELPLIVNNFTYRKSISVQFPIVQLQSEFHVRES